MKRQTRNEWTDKQTGQADTNKEIQRQTQRGTDREMDVKKDKEEKQTDLSICRGVGDLSVSATSHVRPFTHIAISSSDVARIPRSKVN